MIAYSALTHSPKWESGNEDTYWYTGNIVFAIDGATGLSTRKLVRSGMSDARWIAFEYRDALLALFGGYSSRALCASW